MRYAPLKEIAGTVASVRLALSAAHDYRLGVHARRQRVGANLSISAK